MPNRHVRSVVPNPWNPAAPTWHIVGMFDLMFPICEILQPRPDTSSACWNCCFLPVRACSPTRIPRRHVRSDVSYPWDPAAPLWFLVCMFELIWFAEPVRSWSTVLIPRKYVRSPVPNLWDPVAPTWHVLQPRPDTSYACWNCCSKPVRSCSLVLIPRRHVRSGLPNSWDPAAPSWYLVGMYDLVFRAREIMQHRSVTS